MGAGPYRKCGLGRMKEMKDETGTVTVGHEPTKYEERTKILYHIRARKLLNLFMEMVVA